jgi:hypothetical protein
MKHIDLFEVPDGDLYMVPDEGDTVYMHSPEATTDTFAYEARHLIENEDGYREGWGYCGSRRSAMEALIHPDTRHIADYSRVIETEELTEDALHLFAWPGERGVYFLGPIVAHLALNKALPAGPECGRCEARTTLIGIYDVAPWGSHQEVQHTMMYQCPMCGYYRQRGFEDGADWTGDKLSFRSWVRLLPDPYIKTGRLRMTYEFGGRRLNLDGVSLRTGQPFELYADGTYRGGRVEVGAGDRFYFIFGGSDETTDLLPGMLARVGE